MQPLRLTFFSCFLSLMTNPFLSLQNPNTTLSLSLSLSLSLFFLLCSSHFSDTQPQSQIKIQIPLSPSLSQIIVHACLDLHTYKSQPTNPNQNSFVLAYPKPTNGPIINPSNIPFFISSNKIPNSQTHNQPNTYRKEWAFNHTQKNRLKITIEKDEKTTTSGWWALKGLAMEVCGRVMELRFREGLREEEV